MRLLFDQNISFRLVHELEDLFHGSIHVRDVRLASADDEGNVSVPSRRA